MNEHDVDIQISSPGSSAGITALINGEVHIAMSSRHLKSSELASKPTLIENHIADDALAVVVHPTNIITQLSIPQVKSIYNGTFTNWNQVGGPNLAIVLYGRDTTSGTYEAFYELVMGKTAFSASVNELNSNGAVHDAVMGAPGGVGYVGLGYLDSGIKAINIQNATSGLYITPNAANVIAKTYPISRPLFLITDGQPTGLAKDFIDFVLSGCGQKIVQEQGFVPIGSTECSEPPKDKKDDVLEKLDEMIDGFNIIYLISMFALVPLVFILKKRK